MQGIVRPALAISLGAVLGALPGAAGALDRVGAGVALGWGDLAALGVALAGLPVAALSAALWRHDSRAVKSMQARIRARHKVPVETAAVLDHPA